MTDKCPKSLSTQRAMDHAAAKSKPNLAATLPNELVEVILSNLPPEDLIISDASLPLFWRSVLANSNRVFSRLVPLINSPSAENVPAGYQHADWSFKCLRPGGMLIAHRRANGDEKSLFMPTSGMTINLVLFDPKTKIAKFVERPEVVMRGKQTADYGVLELCDRHGDVVFSKRVGGKPQDAKDGVWHYLRAFGAGWSQGRGVQALT